MLSNYNVTIQILLKDLNYNQGKILNVLHFKSQRFFAFRKLCPQTPANKFNSSAKIHIILFHPLKMGLRSEKIKRSGEDLERGSMSQSSEIL